MKRNLKWLLPLFILLLAIGMYFIAGRQSPPDVSGGSTMIQQGSPQDILQYVKEQKSPVVLINFWASWCEPCKEEFPYIMNLKKDWAARGLRVVLVSVDEPGDLAAAGAFLKSQNVDFLTFYKGTQSLKFVSEIYPNWTGAVPATVLMGPENQILDAWEGDTTQAEFEKRIQAHLKGS